MHKGRDYVAIARQYVEDVMSGRTLACDWVRKACRRQLDDLEREASGDPDWPYRFNPKPRSSRGKVLPGPAERICLFTEQLPHIKGEWANRRQLISLAPWQLFILTTVFGWVYRDGYVDPGSGIDLGGKRRFWMSYTEVARKNGKSTGSAPIGIFMTCADGEQGAECYSAATKEDQARIAIWDPAKKMVESSPRIRQLFGVACSARSIFHMPSNSRFTTLSSERHSIDALNVHCGIIDELHAHRNPDVYQKISSARGSRLQPLIWMITTAGSDRSGICYQQHLYATKILDRVAFDETFFGIIYTLDEGYGDDWRDERVWIKANPNLDVSVYSKDLRAERDKAVTMPSALSAFLTERMNVWVSASTNLFNVTRWQALADPCLEPEQFKEDPCWIGVDFAPRNDFTSRVLLFRREIEGADGLVEAHYYAFAKHFLSEGKVEEAENASYPGWAREGWIHTNPGNQTDDRELEEDLVGIIEAGYNVQEIDCDEYRLQGVQTRTEERTGFPHENIRDIPQNPQNLCPAAEKFSALIADGKIHHNGDPVLAWMVSNTIGKPKGNWGLYPDRQGTENKIDGVIALLTALSRAMVGESDNAASPYEERPSFLQL